MPLGERFTDQPRGVMHQISFNLLPGRTTPEGSEYRRGGGAGSSVLSEDRSSIVLFEPGFWSLCFWSQQITNELVSFNRKTGDDPTPGLFTHWHKSQGGANHEDYLFETSLASTQRLTTSVVWMGPGPIVFPGVKSSDSIGWVGVTIAKVGG